MGMNYDYSYQYVNWLNKQKQKEKDYNIFTQMILKNRKVNKVFKEITLYSRTFIYSDSSKFKKFFDKLHDNFYKNYDESLSLEIKKIDLMINKKQKSRKIVDLIINLMNYSHDKSAKYKKHYYYSGFKTGKIRERR